MDGWSLFKLLRAPDKLMPWHQRMTIVIMQCNAEKTKRQLQSSATDAEYESENRRCCSGFETVFMNFPMLSNIHELRCFLWGQNNLEVNYSPTRISGGEYRATGKGKGTF
jgi:hypothetical protein